MRWVLLSGLMVACGGYETYLSEENAATCDWYDRCDLLDTIGYDDVEDCMAELDGWDAADPPSCEGYDRSAAQSCLSGWDALACDAAPKDHPGACLQVCEGS